MMLVKMWKGDMRARTCLCTDTVIITSHQASAKQTMSGGMQHNIGEAHSSQNSDQSLENAILVRHPRRGRGMFSTCKDLRSEEKNKEHGFSLWAIRTEAS